eukprot:scaffold28858_cov39-Phaeocystis_antarctica.AAC.3
MWVAIEASVPMPLLSISPMRSLSDSGGGGSVVPASTRRLAMARRCPSHTRGSGCGCGARCGSAAYLDTHGVGQGVAAYLRGVAAWARGVVQWGCHATRLQRVAARRTIPLRS